MTYGLMDVAGKLFPQLWLYPHVCVSGNGDIRHGSWVRHTNATGSFFYFPRCLPALVQHSRVRVLVFGARIAGRHPIGMSDIWFDAVCYRSCNHPCHLSTVQSRSETVHDHFRRESSQ